MVAELLKPVLVVVVAFVLRWFFALIKFQVDDGFLAALVVAIVSYLIALLGIEGAIRAGLLAR